MEGIVLTSGWNGRVVSAAKGGKAAMRTEYLNDTLSVPMTEERRKSTRYKIDCPVAVLTPGRGKKRIIGRGWLCDISERGARFFLNHAVEVGARISVEVDFRNPGGNVTAIRFPGIVRRVSEGSPSEVAVSLLKGESYIRGKRVEKNLEESLWDQFSNGSIWVN